MERNWNWIWCTSVPPKVRIFIWSCCRHAIPVRERLHHRKVTSDSTCPRCGQDSETIIHCLLSCPYARQIWAISGIPFAAYNSELEEPEQWFHKVRSNLDSKEFGRFAILCWWIWFSRNKLLWEGLNIMPHSLCSFAYGFFNRHQSSLSNLRSIQVNRAIAKWTPPPSGCIKMNMEAAVCSSGKTIGIGLIARNSIGECVGWRGLTIHLPLSPESAEALAALRAMEFCRHSNWENLIIEGDCLSVIQGISNSIDSPGILGPLYEDIKRLARDLIFFKASHVVRECNKAAHCLAKLASTCFPFVSVLPNVVLDIVIADSS
ncbi:hypothetical protein ACJIZ3_014832 [Penstemon smallii]|uniref:Uncharacterized protein n=1 Tax=Penstemon smallii TaxID=265156 RepID=A0ABD3RKQ7_9LAMI